MGGKVKNPKEYYKHWRDTHKVQIKLAQSKYSSKPEAKAKKEEWFEKNKARTAPQRQQNVRNYYYRHQERMKNRCKPRNDERKRLILTHYGGGNCRCVQCGFSDIRALSIDHLNGDGYGHRKRVGNGIHLYNWLIKNKFPSGFQTLCMNCQFIKRAMERECTGGKD